MSKTGFATFGCSCKTEAFDVYGTQSAGGTNFGTDTPSNHHEFTRLATILPFNPPSPYNSRTNGDWSIVPTLPICNFWAPGAQQNGGSTLAGGFKNGDPEFVFSLEMRWTSITGAGGVVDEYLSGYDIGAEQETFSRLTSGLPGGPEFTGLQQPFASIINPFSAVGADKLVWIANNKLYVCDRNGVVAPFPGDYPVTQNTGNDWIPCTKILNATWANDSPNSFFPRYHYTNFHTKTTYILGLAKRGYPRAFGVIVDTNIQYVIDLIGESSPGSGFNVILADHDEYTTKVSYVTGELVGDISQVVQLYDTGNVIDLYPPIHTLFHILASEIVDFSPCASLTHIQTIADLPDILYSNTLQPTTDNNNGGLGNIGTGNQSGGGPGAFKFIAGDASDDLHSIALIAWYEFPGCSVTTNLVLHTPTIELRAYQDGTLVGESIPFFGGMGARYDTIAALFYDITYGFNQCFDGHAMLKRAPVGTLPTDANRAGTYANPSDPWNYECYFAGGVNWSIDGVGFGNALVAYDCSPDWIYFIPLTFPVTGMAYTDLPNCLYTNTGIYNAWITRPDGGLTVPLGVRKNLPHTSTGAGSQLTSASKYAVVRRPAGLNLTLPTDDF